LIAFRYVRVRVTRAVNRAVQSTKTAAFVQVKREREREREGERERIRLQVRAEKENLPPFVEVGKLLSLSRREKRNSIAVRSKTDLALFEAPLGLHRARCP